VSPNIAGVTLHSEGSLYWLHFDTDADTLWPTLKKFWAAEGIDLKHEQPQLGFMETKWIKDMAQEVYRTVIFSDQAPELRERFRLRLERAPDNAGTRVFINHSSYGVLLDEEAVYTGYLPPSPELEIEMLSRLALFSGAAKEQIRNTSSTYHLIELQAKPVAKNSFEILMPGSSDFVRKKLIQALDRMNIKIKTTADGNIIATPTDIAKLRDIHAEDTSDWEIDDSSDLEEVGFVDWEKAATKNSPPSNPVYTLRLIENTSAVTISISHHADNTQTGAGIKKFSQTLAWNLNR
jgi:uncharacterized lipoprotein